MTEAQPQSQEKARHKNRVLVGCLALTLMGAVGTTLITSYVNDTLYNRIWGPCGLVNGKCTTIPYTYYNESYPCEQGQCVTLLDIVTPDHTGQLVVASDGTPYVNCADLRGPVPLEDYLIYPPTDPLAEAALLSTVAGTAVKDGATFEPYLAYPYTFSEEVNGYEMMVVTHQVTGTEVCQGERMRRESMAEISKMRVESMIEDIKNWFRDAFSRLRGLLPTLATP